VDYGLGGTCGWALIELRLFTVISEEW